jgi:negative regulator of genetic competence, sporulation and motility
MAVKVLVKKEPIDGSLCMENSKIKDEVEAGRSNGCDGGNELDDGEHVKEENMEESRSEEKIKEEVDNKSTSTLFISVSHVCSILRSVFSQ